MQTTPEFFLDLSEFCLHAIPHGLPKHDKFPIPGPVARVREPKEVERFRLPVATSLAILSGVPPKFDQASFVRMQFQVEPVESLPQVLQELLGILAVLKADCKVIRKTHDDHIAARVLPPPLVSPQVEHVVQVHIRKYGGYTPALRRTCLVLNSLPIFHDPCVEPLLNVA
jgi:hypothetical protein